MIDSDLKALVAEKFIHHAYEIYHTNPRISSSKWLVRVIKKEVMQKISLLDEVLENLPEHFIEEDVDRVLENTTQNFFDDTEKNIVKRYILNNENFALW
ncbi:MAG: hypothetical protein LUE16_04900 [Lachnospiraceae bacterium]|nr:hypothetical protein [Lachnospiraceae bacterium]